MGERRERRVVACIMALAICGWSASSVSAEAAEVPDKTAQVEAWLTAGIEPTDVRHDIIALGPAGELAVKAVFERNEAPRYVRLRALSVLQSFETESATRYFADLVAMAQQPSASLGALHPARSSLVLRRALEGLVPNGHLLTPPIDANALDACLVHRDAHVRKAAADVLATRDDAHGQEVLTKQLAREKSNMVKSGLQQALISRSVRRLAPR